MPLSAGTRLGSYEILSALGAGGMGEVYRARDTKLNRNVAIKVLPDVFANDPDRLARFHREAQVLAALNHPSIAQIHGFEDSGGVHALVMQLVVGEDLSDRIAGRSISLDEALPIARQIADGLEAAHEQGIIHRDLKPANIKVGVDGSVKILDFGLAKALDDAPAGQNVTHSPTLSLGATRQGVILGTAGYMAPEQARGQSVDRRGDIWAFGCILYEMLTGKQAFAGETVSDTLAGVLRVEPDWSALPATTTPSIRRLLRRCLDKDPKRRLQHIGDARLELNELDQATQETVSSSRPSRRLLWPVVLAAMAGAIVFGAAAWRLAPQAIPGAPIRFTLPLPPSAPFSELGAPGIALSPDGRTVVYAADNPLGLVVRRLARNDVERLRGAEGGGAPFFSPDGAWVGFFADGKLKRVPLDGGIAVTVSENALVGRGTWGDDDTIVFSSQGSLYQVARDGGATQLVLKEDERGPFRQPQFIPGLRTVLVRRGTPFAESHIEAVDLQKRTTRALVVEGTNPQFASPDTLLFERQGGVWAVRFDPKQLATVGTPVTVLESVRFAGGGQRQAMFAAAANGSLICVGAANTETSIVWLDRTGQATPAISARAVFQQPRLSPDGKRFAVSIVEGLGTDVWVYDLERGQRLKLTTGGRSRRSVWSPDGTKIAIYATPEGRGDQDLFVVPSTGGQPERLLDRPGFQYPDAWSRDDFLVFADAPQAGGPERRDLWVLTPGNTARPLLATSAGERAASFSPDGRWLAFVSNESGRDDVYVLPFPGPGQKIPVSANGGNQPAWSRNGKELFYREGEWMMAATIQSNPFRVVSMSKLFEFSSTVYGVEDNLASYDVAPDGRFLAARRDAVAADEIQVVLNWTDELRGLLKR